MNTKTQIIAGVDEAGRGPWAGPVVSCAVILSNIESEFLPKLIDSKKITEKNRFKIYKQLMDLAQKQAIFYGVGIADNLEIDNINILQATMLAMRRAIINLQKNYKQSFYIWVDGNFLPKFSHDELTFFADDFIANSKAIVGGDALYPCISTASIIAKCYRDLLMFKFDQEFPQYQFAKHKGYGTKAHLQALEKYGACLIHRRSFKPILKIANQ